MPILLLILFSLTAFTQVAPTVCFSASASSTAYTCHPPPLTSYVGNVSVNWTPDATNTTTNPTLNLGPGPKALKDAAGNNLLVGAAVAGSVYIVAFDNTNIRILSGPAAIPTTMNIQQSSVILCYDANDAHTVDFACSRNPSGGPLTTGTLILLRFAAAANGANACVDVETSGCAQISFSDGSPIPAGSLAGDDSGTENTYLLSFDADDDILILMQQLLPDNAAPTLSSCGTGASISGTDRSGVVTVGTAATGCVVNLHRAQPAAARCVVASQSAAAFVYSTSTTSISVVGAALSGTKIDYVCSR